MKFRSVWIIIVFSFFVWGAAIVQAQEKALVLQEMTWKDVQDYLMTNDMVIIPLGSTEQHGPHMPLGTDCYEAVGMSKLISARTGVLVAPVLLAGYSAYHSGFPGTLSLKPETMEQVLLETVEMLMKYGFRRFLFFNYHGGNNIVERKVIYQINQTTEAIAVAIGIGSPIQKPGDAEYFDWHAGVSETSTMLYLKPELVRMERAEKPKINVTPLMKKLRLQAMKDQSLLHVLDSLLATPEETKKGGSSAELSSNGIWSLSDPKNATKEKGEQGVKRMVESAVNFINAWREVMEAPSFP